ncbi:hypothetical protein KA977_06175, partial [Candidatus Dependentiae bacterium]|nr:hypothetical protein [Candidatus Dependentiae bacterium]
TILYLIFFLLFFGIKNFGKPAEKEKYSSIILMKSQYEPEAGLRSIGETLSDAGRKFFVYSLRLVPDMFFYPFFKNVKPSAVSIKFLVQACAGFLLTILILSGFFLRFKPFTPKNIIGQISVSDIYILLTAGMLLIWQIYSSRYLLPILPFLIFNIIYSFNMIADKKIVKYIFMIFITINIIAQFKLIYLERTNYIPGEWKEYYSTLNYLESNNLIKENVSVVCRKPLSYHLLSGYKLKTIGYPLTADTDEIRKFMKYNKINYIVRDNFFISGVDTAGKYLDPFLDKYSSELELLYSSNDGKTKLFKIVFFD